MAILASAAFVVRPRPARASAAAAEAFKALDDCNVVWDSPSTGANGSMPLGNGEVGLNLWVEKDGDLLFYVARTDAWSECSQLLKLGRVRLALRPNPFTAGAPFRQTLNLRKGCVEITAGSLEIRVFVDAQLPIVYVTGHSAKPVRVRASVELWRTQRRDLKAEEKKFAYNNAGSWTMRGAEFGPKDVQAWESADVVDDRPDNAVVWYHRNVFSIVPFDPEAPGTGNSGRSGGRSVAESDLRWLDVGCRLREGRQDRAAIGRTKSTISRCGSLPTRRKPRPPTPGANRRNRFSSSPPRPATRPNAPPTGGASSGTEAGLSSKATRLRPVSPKPTRCNAGSMPAAAAGTIPIKFNGSIFTVDAKYTGKPDNYGPDWREWGDCYWWQNTRLPYQPLPACGDFDLMKPLFKFYRDAAPLCKARAKIYHQVKGVYFPETMTVFGTYSNGDYGWDRRYVKPKDVMCPAWQYCWQQGLELVGIMLDYYDYTEDDAFLSGELMPMARDVLEYFDTRFPRDKSGKIELRPTQMLETYRPQDVLDAQGRVVGRHEVINDTPTVAGLESVLTRLLALPPGKMPAADRVHWQAMKNIVPPLPLGSENGKTFIRPAQDYPKNAWNIENGELYAVSPFRLFGVGKPNLETGLNYVPATAVPGCCRVDVRRPVRRPAGHDRRGPATTLGKSRQQTPESSFSGHVGPQLRLAPRPDSGRQPHAHAAIHAHAGRSRQNLSAARLAERRGTSASSSVRRRTQWSKASIVAASSRSWW